MRKYILGIVYLIVFLGFTSQGQAAPGGKRFTVVIDAGHGGHDPGANSKTIKEKDINLKTALVLGGLIERNCPDVRVIYTRKTDVFVELHRRAQIANQAKADLFISIHTNAVPKGNTVRGAETYTLGMARAEENLEVAKRENEAILLESNYKTTYKGFNPNSSESYIIFEYMQDANMTQSVNFAKKVQSQFRNRAGRIDKGVKQAGFLVLRETSMPSVLIELGYISTPDEAEYLISDKGSYAMGESIYQAFLSYRKAKANVTEPNFTMPEKETSTTEEFTVAPIETVTTPIVEQNQQLEKTQKKEAEKVETKKTEPAKKTETKKVETSKNTSAAPVFMIQILTSDRKLAAGNSQFKGLKNVESFKDGKIYKYTYGASTNYNEVLKTKREISAQFKDCFIIAKQNGEKIDVNEAIKIYKANKQK